MIVQPLVSVLARDMKPRVVVETEHFHLRLIVAIGLLNMLRHGLVAQASKDTNGLVRPTEQVEAALEELAMHRVDMFLVPEAIALTGLLEEQPTELLAQGLMIRKGHPSNRYREEVLDLWRWNLHCPRVLSSPR